MNQPPRLRIRNWNQLYENNRSRELDRTSWLPFPNDLSSDVYVELVAQDNGAALWGAWTALLMIASRSTPRGLLVRPDGRAHSPQSLAFVTRLPAALFSDVLDRAIQMQLVEDIDEKPRKMKSLVSHRRAIESQPVATESHSGAQKERKEQKEEKELSPEVLTPLDATVKQVARRIHDRHPAVRRCGVSIIERELRKIAHQFPAAEQIAKLDEIDQNHTSWCDFSEWQKDSGQYAKGLENWIRASMQRWAERPPDAVETRSLTKSERSLVEAGALFDQMRAGNL